MFHDDNHYLMIILLIILLSILLLFDYYLMIISHQINQRKIQTLVRQVLIDDKFEFQLCDDYLLCITD